MKDRATRLMPIAAALAIIVAIAGSLWMRSRDHSAPEPVAAMAPVQGSAATPPAPPPRLSAAAGAFVAFAREEPPQDLPLDHGYTAEGLRRLAAAVAGAGESALWRDRASRLEAAAADLEKDAASLRHADVAREAFVDVADWLEAADARSAAEALNAAQPLRSQREHVNRFFRKMAASLEQGNA